LDRIELAPVLVSKAVALEFWRGCSPSPAKMTSLAIGGIDGSDADALAALLSRLYPAGKAH